MSPALSMLFPSSSGWLLLLPTELVGGEGTELGATQCHPRQRACLSSGNSCVYSWFHGCPPVQRLWLQSRAPGSSGTGQLLQEVLKTFQIIGIQGVFF